ncbi:MAG: DUF1439 domain-containing protein [Pseudomonadota bacterium]|nr:DUF1439 domain-containing protein [Pseudomonadota bacterium]
MRRLHSVLAILLILLALTAAAWWAFQRFVGELALNLEPATLQQHLAERFPVRNCPLVLVCVEFSQPRLSLPTDADRLQLDTQMAVQAGGREFPGRAGLSGKLRYERAAGAFYIDDLTVTDFALDGVPERYAALVKAHGPLAVQSALRDRPLYVIDTSTTAGALARWALRDVRVVKGRLRVSLFKGIS